MAASRSKIFSRRFLNALQGLVDQHHVVYPRLPPQGIYFESLVERAFKIIRQPYTQIEPSNPNSPKHDLLVKDARISVKSETGRGTKPAQINITKLCTTEKDPWTIAALKRHVMNHLSQYDYMLMIRAVWDKNVIHYQILDIPLDLLKRIGEAEIAETGRRSGRRSLAGDVNDPEGNRLFRVHFDGADGKCQVQRLPVKLCSMLLSWDYQLRD